MPKVHSYGFDDQDLDEVMGLSMQVSDLPCLPDLSAFPGRHGFVHGMHDRIRGAAMETRVSARGEMRRPRSFQPIDE